MALKELKIRLTTALVLKIADSMARYIVVIDALDLALRGIIMQKTSEGTMPLVFLSKILRPTEEHTRHMTRRCLESLMPWKIGGSS